MQMKDEEMSETVEFRPLARLLCWCNDAELGLAGCASSPPTSLTKLKVKALSKQASSRVFLTKTSQAKRLDEAGEPYSSSYVILMDSYRVLPASGTTPCGFHETCIP